MTDGEDGFLRRWSRRKHESRRGPAAAPEAVPMPEAPPAASAPPPDPEREAAADDGEARPAAAPPAGTRPGPVPPVAPESLPDIAGLGPDSDFRAFMQPGVPPELRTRALRRLWRVKPLVRDPERLVDYDEDYTDAARVVAGGIRTLYRVGRGVLTDGELAALEAERVPGADGSGEGPAGDATATADAAGSAAPPDDGEPADDDHGHDAARRPPAGGPDAAG